MYKFVAYKKIMEELKSSTDKDVMDFYGRCTAECGKYIKAMGWNLSDFGLGDSKVNKDRQTQALFEETLKTNVEQISLKEKPKLIVSPKSLYEEEIVDIVNKYRFQGMNSHVTPDKVVC
ncbi:hypothetical protein RhiirA4_418927 [Rhizophagus irregularis]|uniref:Uncharacterized protein n=1 Tax=Rhizophagus irregularis TaxID=588596 RepID=A0A2I1GCF6_9GLOM|nr:hypothetical protein RhiirA4_418927 [Rhizophagus irregularis]